MQEFLCVLKAMLLYSLHSLKSFFMNIGVYAKLLFKNLKAKIKYGINLAAPHWRSLKKRWIAMWCFCLLLFVGLAMVLFNLTRDYYIVSYNGKNLGYLKNENILPSTIANIQSAFPDSKVVKEDLSGFTVTKLQTGNIFLDCMDRQELTELIINVAESVEYGYTVYIDKEFVANVPNEKVYNNALGDYKDDRITLSKDINKNYDKCTIKVLKTVSIKKGCLLSSEIETKQPYDVLYDAFEGKLPYRIECLQTVTESIPYVTYYQRNNDLYPGAKYVRSPGKNGIKEVQSKLIIENGELISNKVVGEKVVKNSVMRRVEIGNGTSTGVSGGMTLLLPVEGYLTSDYGDRKDPFTGEPAFHRGMDIAATKGTPIIAAASGKVIQSSDKNNGYGKCVIIEHSSGFRTLYGHCSSLDVKVGEYVKAGQVIAKVGSTGRSTGPHLHFSVLINGKYVDPNLYFK